MQMRSSHGQASEPYQEVGLVLLVAVLIIPLCQLPAAAVLVAVRLVALVLVMLVLLLLLAGWALGFLGTNLTR